MTQQYLAGELSLLLARLQAATANQPSARALARLRREAETWPTVALASVVVRALELADRLCWDALERRDAAGFTGAAAISAELHDFGISARLLEER
jgi:hypothetical protein